MKSKFCYGLALIAAFVVLAWSDRSLRRLENIDHLVFSGQTGFSWIDDFFSKRAAQQIELKRLVEVAQQARTPDDRLAAHYAVFNFESKQGRSDSRQSLASLETIVQEGGRRPATAVAWRELLKLAQARRDLPEANRLAQEYAQMAIAMPAHPEKLSRLLDAWNIHAELKSHEMGLRLLECIQTEYPVSIEALAAYEALALKYRARGEIAKEKQAEECIRKTRALALRQREEIERSQTARLYLQDKDAARAEKALLSLSPGLSPMVNYGDLYIQLINLYESAHAMDAAERFIVWVDEHYPRHQMKDDQRSLFSTSAALLYSEAGRWEKAREALAQSSPDNLTLSWRNHIQARLDWIQKKEAGMLAKAKIPWTSVPILPSVEKTSKMSPWYSLGVNTNFPSAPTARWRGAYDEGRLYLQVECEEPEPQRMKIQHQHPEEPVWEDDCVEIFVAPFSNDLHYGQIVGNSKGVLTDLYHTRSRIQVPLAYASDMKWSSGAKSAARKTESGWMLAVSIPWKSLAIRPGDGLCFLNVRRQRYVSGKLELFSWTPSGLASMNPSSMELLVLERRP